MTNQNTNNMNAGCLTEILIIAAVYIALSTIISMIFWAITGVFPSRSGGTLILMLAAAIVGWFATLRYKRRMEKQLGRKVKGDHELTSIISWMEASSKEDKPRVTRARPDMNPKEKAELSRRNLEEIIRTDRTQGRQAAHDLIKQLILPGDEENPANVEYKIITAGGRENGPLDVDTIRDLFDRKLINSDTLVFDPSLNQWRRLADVFNITNW